MDFNKIISQYNTLTPELQKAAKYLVNNPQDVVTLSMRALAKKACVQAGTLLRLAKQLGFNNWLELKSSFIDELGLKKDDYAKKARNLLKTSAKHIINDEIYLSLQKNIEQTAKLNDAQMAEAATLLKQSKNVYIAGFRASFPIAYYFFYVYRLFRKNIYLIDGLAGDIEIITRDFAEKDTVVVIGFEPYSREILTIVDMAKKHQSKILALTDSQVSPLALEADIALRFSTDSPSFFPSIASGIGVIESLLALLVTKYGSQAVKEIERAEKHLIDSGTYVSGMSKQ